jgi:hypothetical protein
VLPRPPRGSWDYRRQSERFVALACILEAFADAEPTIAGIPTIIKPFFGDQFFWADRVEAMGIGSGVRKLTVDTLAEALRTATTDRKQIDRAKLIGAQIRNVSAMHQRHASVQPLTDFAIFRKRELRLLLKQSTETLSTLGLSLSRFLIPILDLRKPSTLSGCRKRASSRAESVHLDPHLLAPAVRPNGASSLKMTLIIHASQVPHPCPLSASRRVARM